MRVSSIHSKNNNKKLLNIPGFEKKVLLKPTTRSAIIQDNQTLKKSQSTLIKPKNVKFQMP
jgi:hypothetical protein